MEGWATRRTRIATYALAACAGAVVWLLLTAATASADERTRPAGDPGEQGPAAAGLRSAPSSLGEGGSAATRDRAAPSESPGAKVSPALSLARTVGAVGDVAPSGQREVGRTLDPVVDAVPAADRTVDAVTDQVDRTTDAGVETVSEVARTVDVAVTEPLVRPVVEQLPGRPTEDPAPVPDEPAAASIDRLGRAGSATETTRAPVRPHPRPASDLDAPRHLAPPASPLRVLPDPAALPVPDEDLRTSGAPVVADLPAAVPDDGQRDVGEPAGAVASADGGVGALAVLDGRAPDRADAASDQSLPQWYAPQGPSFGPAFSPG